MRLLTSRPLATGVMRPGRLPIRLAAPSIAYQRANYSPIPPLDKKNDDLGLGVVALFSIFASPRQIAQHQIENDKVIGGGPSSNTGKALADLKRRDGVKTSHQLHQEQSGSSILGTK